ncbi:MAG TPA: hypothetical protein VD996_14720 [Chitinophagaceae bacterium]|nr:hypothetical protein [Chitinophagaceae bacterium]
MKYLIYTFILFSFLACKDTRPKLLPEFGKPADKLTKDFDLSGETAHPNASRLMNEAFFWSADEETAPFGNREGGEAAHSFGIWRAHYKSESPVIFLRQLLNSWGVPYFDWNETDSLKIKAYIQTLPGNSAAQHILSQDNVIIGTAFSQFVLEGKTDTELQAIANNAITRQLLPVLINRYDEPYREQRATQLNKMLAVVRQMNKP